MEITDAHRRNYTVLTASEVPLSSYQVRVSPVSTHRAEPHLPAAAGTCGDLSSLSDVTPPGTPFLVRNLSPRSKSSQKPPSAAILTMGQVSLTWMMLPSERLGKRKARANALHTRQSARDSKHKLKSETVNLEKGATGRESEEHRARAAIFTCQYFRGI